MLFIPKTKTADPGAGGRRSVSCSIQRDDTVTGPQPSRGNDGADDGNAESSFPPHCAESGGRCQWKTEKNQLKVLPSEKVDGKDAFVIEAAPKGATSKRVSRIKIFLTKENGIIVKMLGYDTAGSEMMAIMCNNIKINPKIDVSRFVFEAPENVQIVDYSNR